MTDLTTEEGMEQTPKTIFLKDYRAPDYIVEQIDLTFHLSAPLTKVESKLQVKRAPGIDSAAPLVLDGQLLKLIRLAINDQDVPKTKYTVGDEQLVISSVPESFTLMVVTEIEPAKNTALEGLYASSSMLCTQCEAQGFRRITYFPDRPDVMSRYQVRMIADKKTYPVLLSNGNLIESGELDNGQHYAVWQDPSLKPSY